MSERRGWSLIYAFDDYELDTERFELRRDGGRRPVEPQVLDLLVHLVANRNRVVGREELLARVWGTQHVSDATVTSRLRDARAAIGDDGATQALIRTVRGRGYRFVGELREAPTPDTPPETPGSPDLPAALSRGEAPAGRERALALLDATWRDARGGTTRIASVAGEPGIGKTSLAAALAARVRTEGAEVLYGPADEAGVAPYAPFLEALGGLSDGRRGLPWEATEPPGTAADAGLARYRGFEAVRRLIEDRGTSRPVLLVLDDLHWADLPSLLLLRHLARTMRRARALLLVTHRDTDLRPGHPLPDALAALRREHPLRTVRLEGLGEPAVAELILRWGRGEGGARADASDLRRLTGGNPLFLRELLRAGGDDSDPPPQDAADVIAARLRRLGPQTAEVLGLAAVIGTVVDHAELESAAAGAHDPGAVLDALEAAAAAGLVAETGDGERWAFAHGLVREALVAGMSAARRRRAHLRIAEAMTAPARVAHHLLEALPAGDPRRAVAAARAAAADATRGLAFEDAADVLGRALAAWRDAGGEPATACDLLLELGDALSRAGGAGDARDRFGEAAELARDLGDPDRLAAAALGAGGLAVAITDLDEPLEALLREALAAAGDAPTATRARLLSRLAIEVYYADRAEADRLSAAAVAAARETRGDDAALATALTARRAAIWAPERAEERLATADAIVRHARRAGDREGELHGRNWRVLDLLELGRADDARAEVGAFSVLADEVGLPHHRWYVPLWGAALAGMEGRFADGERLRAEALTLGREADDPNAENFVGIQELSALYEQGRLDEIDVDRVLARSRRPRSRVGWAGFIAAVHWLRGERAAARATVAELAAGDFAAVPADANWHVLADVGEACALIGDAGWAARVHSMLLPWAGLFAVTARAVWCTGSVRLVLGRLADTMGDVPGAVTHLEAALAANARASARPRAALAAAHLAAALERRGAPGDAGRADGLRLQADAEAAACDVLRR